MTFFELLVSSFPTIGAVVVAMAIVAALEALLPRRRPQGRHRAHVGPNLALTATTFVTNAFLNAGLVLGLFALQAAGYQPLRALGLGALGTALIVVAVLELAWYAAHRTMHRVPFLWRIHAVHHSDPAIDVTTTIRQHPAEGLVRYAYMGAAALAIGATPAAFAVYRIWSVLQGLWTHADIRVPARVEALLGYVLVTPRVHDLHHCRSAKQSPCNYGTITTAFDRLFGSFERPRPGVEIAFGLDGHDEPHQQTTAALFRAPFRAPVR